MQIGYACFFGCSQNDVSTACNGGGEIGRCIGGVAGDSHDGGTEIVVGCGTVGRCAEVHQMVSVHQIVEVKVSVGQEIGVEGKAVHAVVSPIADFFAYVYQGADDVAAVVILVLRTAVCSCRCSHINVENYGMMLP